MKALLILAAAGLAVPAFAQTQVTITPSIAHAPPRCAVDGSCPALAATIRAQTGTAAAAAPAMVPAEGGPYQPVTAGAALRVRTTDTYPPCRGAVVDRCIQLHERGVRR